MDTRFRGYDELTGLAKVLNTFSYPTILSAFSALRLGPMEFSREIKTAAVVEWYAEGQISQSKATEILQITRLEFYDLKAGNPNARADENAHTSAQLLEFTAEKGRDAAAALERLRGL